MKLCMFSPKGMELERGWPGRIDGDEVVQLAAQTLQAFFSGGGTAREHARYPLAEVELRPPVLHPPSVRDFYVFEQHVRTARERRGLEVPPDGTSWRSSTSRTLRRSSGRAATPWPGRPEELDSSSRSRP